jgi:hypothetical protein
VHEADLPWLAALTGSTYDKVKQELEEGTFDIPDPVAPTFSALRRDGGYRLYRYYVAKLQSYSVSHSTKGVSNDGQPYKFTFKALPRKIDGKIRNTHDIAQGDPLTWLNSIPSLPSGVADLSALSFGSLTLSPAFDAGTIAYTTSTSNATNTITATAADANATVAITVGSTPVTNGQAATGATGDNTVTITVTNGSTIKTYTITVTKS